MNRIRNVDRTDSTSNDKGLLKYVGPYRIQTTWPFPDNEVMIIGTIETVPPVVIGELVWIEEKMLDDQKWFEWDVDEEEKSSGKEEVSSDKVKLPSASKTTR